MQKIFPPRPNGVSNPPLPARRNSLQALFPILLLLIACVRYGEAQAAQLRLSWIDNSNNEDGFEIERKIGENGTFAQIASQGANFNFYSDGNLMPGTPYCYRVRAFNAFGNSGYTNEACATAATIIAMLESPENGQPVSGITIIRGWGFDTQGGGKISGVDLFIDGTRASSVPCCSPRSDVQATFPQFPSLNTENSGWGAVMNWGVLNVGFHTVQVQLRSTAGGIFSTEPHMVTVVKPGDFEFLDQFDLSHARVSIVGDELVVERVVVRDKVSQQKKEIDGRFRWFSSSQSLGMVEAVTKQEVSSAWSLFVWLFSPFVTALEGVSTPTGAYAAPGLFATFESPEEVQAVSGIGLSRGWAFAEQPGDYVAEVGFLIDGTLGILVPCCSTRADVAAAFPAFPNALNSGWGITFNYGVLSSGFHMLGVQIRSSAGDLLTLSRGMTVVRLGDFEFLDQFDLSNATAKVQDGTLIVVQRVKIRDKVSGQNKVVDVFLQWMQSIQALEIVASNMAFQQ
jgi:hypothetical protein